MFKTFAVRPLHGSCKSLLLCVIFILTCWRKVTTHQGMSPQKLHVIGVLM